MALESTVTNRIRRWVNAQPGMWCLKVHGHPEQIAGVPDLLCCVRGRFVALEVKLPGEVPTPLQAFTMREMDTAGAVTAVVYSLADARAVIESLWSSPNVPYQSVLSLRGHR